MLRSLLIAWLVAIIGSVLLFSRTTTEPRADFVYVNSSDLHTLDPARMSWTPDFRVALNVWEGLSTFDARAITPGSGAASIPPEVSANGLVYTFTIRDDARWSNGDSVTAQDFVRGWRRAMEPGTGGDYVFLFTENIDGAAEYVQWRRQAIAVLALLSDLGAGRSITEEQARQLVNENLLTDSSQRGQVPEPHWHAVRAEFLTSHAASLDSHFREVGIEASDDKTLRVRLVNPCPYFLDLAAFATLLPIHQSIEMLREREADLPINDHGLVVYDPQWTKPDYRRNGYPGLITNGAFTPADWLFKRRLRMKRNPHFHSASTVPCETVDMVVYENLNTALIAYESGSVDLLPAMPTTYGHEIARLARTGGREDFRLCPVLATYYLALNCQKTTGDGRANPLHDARVRRALALAIDKELLVNGVIGRGDRVAASFVPPNAVPGYTPPTGPPHDPTEARRLLADADHAGGAGLPPIELLHVGNDDRVVGAIARMWEETLGIRVELVTKESKTFGEDKAAHRFMVARGNWYADYNDPTSFLDCLLTAGGNNDSAYANTEYDDLLLRARIERDPDRRWELLRQAESLIVHRDFPIIPLLHFSEPVAISPRVRGLHANSRLWFPFRDVLVER